MITDIIILIASVILSYILGRSSKQAENNGLLRENIKLQQEKIAMNERHIITLLGFNSQLDEIRRRREEMERIQKQ